MSEDYLQFIWQNRLFKSEGLCTVQGETLQVLHTGFLNSDQGPDFLEARVKIGHTEWVGNIEVHLKASDFYRHKHHLDKAYSNLILHVVLENDITAGNLPVLEIKSFLNKGLENAYHRLFENKNNLPCKDFVSEIDTAIKTITLQQKAIERLEEKCKRIELELIHQQNNWEAVFWQQLFKYSGGTVNAQPFEELAKQLDWNFLVKQTHQPLLIEAIIFGLAGFLDEAYNDNYFAELKNTFTVYRNYLKSNSLQLSAWRFMRMRPNSFPTIRLSQLANLLVLQPDLFSKIVSPEITIQDLLKLFTAKANSFWENHYSFKNPLPSKHTQIKEVGYDQKNVWIINAVVPLLFAYGSLTGIESVKERAVFLLESLPAEKNQFTRLYSTYNFNFKNAVDSQGVLQLRKNYCLKQQCLKCSVGIKILRNFVN